MRTVGRGRGWGWIGCFAARNILHYTMGVVYKRLFFFSLSFSLFSLSFSFYYFVSLIFFLSLVLFPASLAFRPTWGWVLRGDKARSRRHSFFEKLRKISCTMLGASLRDSLRETSRERLVCQIKDGGTKARINDKRVHESLANVLISGERRAREKTFSF